MNNSTLIQYFRRLNAKDLREMDKFVRSPFFNSKTEIILLFEHLRTLVQKPTAALQKEKVYAHLFPKKAYDEKQLGYLLSELVQLIKRYLAISVAEQEQNQQQVHLCRALRQRRMDKQFQQELELAHKKLNKQSLRNSEYHYHHYLLQQEKVAYNFVTLDQRRSGAELLEKVNTSLTTFYIIELLRHGCDILALQSLKAHDSNLDLLEEVLRYIQQKEQMTQSPAISIYYHSYQAMKTFEKEKTNDSIDHFKILKSEIQQHWQSFSKREIRDIYTLAVNYCIKKLNQGDQRYIREAFDLYRSGLDHQVWLEDKVLSGYTYKNVARLGIALEEEEWVMDFIETYKKFLPKKDGEQYWRYNLAYLYFQKEDYEKAMQYLREVEFKDVFNNLDSRLMLLRCYYELEEIFALEYLLDSLQKYIQRQKGIGYHKNNYLNLIRFMRKKLQLSDLDKEKRALLAQEIRKTEQVAEKTWLLKQVEK